jgi:hypothetical protein
MKRTIDIYHQLRFLGTCPCTMEADTCSSAERKCITLAEEAYLLYCSVSSSRQETPAKTEKRADSPRDSAELRHRDARKTPATDVNRQLKHIKLLFIVGSCPCTTCVREAAHLPSREILDGRLPFVVKYNLCTQNLVDRFQLLRNIDLVSSF